MPSAVTGKEKTRAQVTGRSVGMYSGIGPSELQRGSMASARSYKRYQEMRTDPTIALSRWLSSAPIIASAWSTESTDAAPEGAKEFIDSQSQSLRLHLLSKVALGEIDYGWQPFEKVLHVTRTGQIGIAKLKPLLQSDTTILVDEDTGAYAGLKNFDVELEVEDTLLFSFEPEGTDFYGSPIMENARKICDKWDGIEKAATRYDDKIAGTHLVIHYPPGTSEVNGVETQNSEIADMIFAQWQASGCVRVPTRASDIMPTGNSEVNAWKIELLSDNSAGRGNFVERQKYLDALKVRAFGLPERSILEGTYGTKAEAEAHGDFAITCMELRHQAIAQTYNWHAVNHLLRLNYGEQYENTVYIKPAPINDSGKAFLRELYKSLMANDNLALLESDSLDMQAYRDSLGLPTKATADDNGLPIEEKPQVVTPLNGAQITSAVELLTQMKSGTVSADAAAALLESLGIAPDDVARMIATQQAVPVTIPATSPVTLPATTPTPV